MINPDKGIKSSELWVTVAGMIAMAVTAYTGIPMTPGMVIAGLSALYGAYRTAYKIVMRIKGKKEAKDVVTEPLAISQEDIKAVLELIKAVKKSPGIVTP